MKNKVYALILGFILITVAIAIAWTGSTPYFEWVSPVYTSVQTIKSPLPLKVKIYNPDSANDYSVAYIAQDTNGDSVIDDGEWTAKIQVPFWRTKHGVNIDAIDQNSTIVIDWLYTDSSMPDGYYYFLVGATKDIGASWSLDLTQAVGKRYDGTIPGFARFYLSGSTP